jgi:hypothetical protein
MTGSPRRAGAKRRHAVDKEDLHGQGISFNKADDASFGRGSVLFLGFRFPFGHSHLTK